MINKFKDFVKKKLSRKKSNDLSDQDEMLEQEESYELNRNSTDDSTGDVSLMAPKRSFKERLESTMAQLKSKMPGIRMKSFKLPKNISTNISDGAPLLSPSLSRNVELFLSRASRGPIHQVAMVALVCGLTYSLGTITALVLKGSPEIASTKSHMVSISLEKDFNAMTLNQVKGQNIFRTNVSKKTNKMADTKCEEAQQASSLPIKLVNTIVLQDEVKSLASVQVRGGRDLREIRQGDKIDNMAEIFKITRLEILIKNLENGVCESVTSSKAQEVRSTISVMNPEASREFKANKKIPGIENKGNKFAIQKALLDEKLKDIASILTQARAIKIQNPDGTLSFKMTEMDPAGIFPYLGLQDQDIITAINGKPIYDINEVMSLFGRIKNVDNLSLGIKREGMDSTQEYSITK